MAETSAAGQRSWGGMLAPLFVIAVAAAVGVAFIDSPLLFDEYYHLLAGRSWATDGSLVVRDGEYTRGRLFTVLVGALFRMFGESPEIARTPSVAASALTAGLLFGFLRREASASAAWIASGLLIIDPAFNAMSVYARFYALQTLLFLVMALAVYRMADTGRRPLGIAMFGLLGLASMGLALHLQVTTLIGLAALFAWWTYAERDLLRRGWARLPGSAGLKLALMIGAGVGVAWLAQDLLARLWHLYRMSPLWVSMRRNDPLYYITTYAGLLQGLWLLYPAALLWLLALGRHARLASFAAIMFMLPLLIHSFGGAKSWHYAGYLFPFFYMAWGLALSEGYAAVTRFFDGRIRGGDLATLARFRWSGHVLSAAVLLLALMLVRPLNLVVIDDLIDRVADAAHRPVDGWRAAEPRLRELASQVDTVMTTADTAALYHIGRYEYAVTPSQVLETDTRREFGKDPRTGGYLIGNPESVRRVVECTRSGLFVSALSRWRNPLVGIDDEGARYLLAHTRLVPLPEAWNMILLRWQHEAAAAGPRCEALPLR